MFASFEKYSVVKYSTSRRPLMDEDPRGAGPQLRKFRQANGLSQVELADRAKIDRTYISAVERSVYAASIDVVDRLARGLGVEAADLLRRPTASTSVGKKERRAGNI